MINMKKERTTEEAVVEDTITTDNAIMTIGTETIKIETETTIEKILKEIIKIGRQESIKTETMEIDSTKIGIKRTTNLETETIIANLDSKMEERKNITPKINPERTSM